MSKNVKSEAPAGGVSKVRLALGAASLFLFIVGLKRTFRSEDGLGPVADGERGEREAPEPRAAPRGR